MIRKHGEVLIADREDFDSQQSLADLLEEAGDWAFDVYWNRVAEENRRHGHRTSAQRVIDELVQSKS